MAIPTVYEKKHGDAVLFFVSIECWGFRRETRTQRTFREKSFGISKAFAKVKWYVRREILLPTFLIRKVGGTPFSEKKVCYSVFMEYPMPRIVDMIFIPNFSSSFSLKYLI